MAELTFVEPEIIKDMENFNSMMVHFETGISINKFRVFRDELRIIDARSRDRVIARIELGIHDKWALLSELMTDLISKPDGESKG